MLFYGHILLTQSSCSTEARIASVCHLVLQEICCTGVSAQAVRILVLGFASLYSIICPSLHGLLLYYKSTYKNS